MQWNGREVSWKKLWFLFTENYANQFKEPNQQVFNLVVTQKFNTFNWGYNERAQSSSLWEEQVGTTRCLYTNETFDPLG